MAASRFLAIASLAAALALPAAAKTPEAFVGAAPAADSADRPQRRTARAAAAPATLDTARIHALYLEGDFDKAIRSLEAALKAKKGRTHADSVFIFKHLGVMYAATPDTREKGRYYMLQLISIEPTARILDMYASDMIYLIFRNVQEEYEKKRVPAAAAAAPDTAAVAEPAAPPKDTVAAAPPPPPPKRDRTLYWVAGGTAIAAGAIGLLFVLFDDPDPKRRDIVIQE